MLGVQYLHDSKLFHAQICKKFRMGAATPVQLHMNCHAPQGISSVEEDGGREIGSVNGSWHYRACIAYIGVV